MVAEIRVRRADDLEPLAGAGEDRGHAHAVSRHATVAAMRDDTEREHPGTVAAAVAVVLVVHRDDVAEADVSEAEPLDHLAPREHHVAVRPLRAHAEPGAHHERGHLRGYLHAQPTVVAGLEPHPFDERRAAAPRGD